jgi:hypothetical protein
MATHQSKASFDEITETIINFPLYNLSMVEGF